MPGGSSAGFPQHSLSRDRVVASLTNGERASGTFRIGSAPGHAGRGSQENGAAFRVTFYARCPATG